MTTNNTSVAGRRHMETRLKVCTQTTSRAADRIRGARAKFHMRPLWRHYKKTKNRRKVLQSVENTPNALHSPRFAGVLLNFRLISNLGALVSLYMRNIVKVDIEANVPILQDVSKKSNRTLECPSTLNIV